MVSARSKTFLVIGRTSSGARGTSTPGSFVVSLRRCSATDRDQSLSCDGLLLHQREMTRLDQELMDPAFPSRPCLKVFIFCAVPPGHPSVKHCVSRSGRAMSKLRGSASATSASVISPSTWRIIVTCPPRRTSKNFESLCATLLFLKITPGHGHKAPAREKMSLEPDLLKEAECHTCMLKPPVRLSRGSRETISDTLVCLASTPKRPVRSPKVVDNHRHPHQSRAQHQRHRCVKDKKPCKSLRSPDRHIWSWSRRGSF